MSRLGGLVRVARFEYRRHLRSKQFIGTTLGMPLFMVAIGAVSAWSGSTAQQTSRHPWGFVAVTASAEAQATLAASDLRAFDTVADADRALAAGDIGGFAERTDYARYTATAWEAMPDGVASTLRDAVRAEAIAAAPALLRARWSEPVRVRYALAAAPNDVRPPAALWATLGIAFAVPLALTLAVLFSTTLLVTAVAEEKSNRLLECLATSVAPTALVGGKVVGLGLLALTQLAVWAAGAMAAAAIGLRVGASGSFVASLPWGTVALAAAWLLGGYLVQAAVVVSLGIVIGEPREAQQVAGFASLGLVLPFSLAGLLVFRPASPAAVWLSIVPLTSPVAMPIRLLLSAVPVWQAVISALLLAVTAAASLAAAGALFRYMLLRPPLRWRRLFGRRFASRGAA
ncbi:MAG: ABC transporter permease [Ardenticatenales bacterium]